MLYEHMEALSWFASFRYLNFPGMERVLEFVLPRSVTQGRQDHFNLTREMVHKRLETPPAAAGGAGPQHRGDFIAHMLHNGDDTNNKGMSIPEVEANINELLLAGSETSSTALTGITNFLLQNPSELATLVDEIRTAFTNETDMTSSAVHELRHLGAVIEEGLRLAPPIPIGLGRIVAPEGQFVSGHWTPGVVRPSPHPSLYPPNSTRSFQPTPPPATPFMQHPSPKLTHPLNSPDPRLRHPIRRQPLPPLLRLALQLPSVALAASQQRRVVVLARFPSIFARVPQLHRQVRVV